MNQFVFPPISKLNKIIVIATTASFVLDAILKLTGGFALETIIGLFPPNFYSGFIFQLVTYPLYHNQLLDFIFSSLIVWWIGSELEYILGFKRYLLLYLTVTVGTGLFFLGINYFFINLFVPVAFSGLQGFNYSLLILYAIFYPTRPMLLMGIFPLKAKYFCLILGFMEFYLSIFSPHKIISLSHLFSILCAVLFVFIMDRSLLSFNAPFKWKKREAPKRRSHLKIVENDDESNKKNDPKYWH